MPSTTNQSSKVCGSGLDCGRVTIGGIAVVSVAQNHYEPIIRRRESQVLYNSSGSLAIFAAIRAIQAEWLIVI